MTDESLDAMDESGDPAHRKPLRSHVGAHKVAG
jgi:hypothetical protein